MKGEKAKGAGTGATLAARNPKAQEIQGTANRVEWLSRAVPAPNLGQSGGHPSWANSHSETSWRAVPHLARHP